MQIEIPAHVTAAMSSQEVPESQFDQDDPEAHLDEVVRKDILVINKAWHVMAEGDQSFTPYVSERKKKSASQTDNIRSKGPPFHMSL
ncbi:hypothetical protein A2U01_0050401 [Trifolium medium]|uniref:Uncharacterized protein n=1 Tax=Trifolium medium TaxID=97028 RepID=A0A392QZA2_9FABA|nr:hypothetical protein [Trifolium medium]